MKNTARIYMQCSALYCALVFLFAFVAVGASAQESAFAESCIRQNLPVTVGGSRDDIASCLVYHPESELLIVGGTTKSSDFGPANSNYGFLYAVSLEGDWTWGHYFLNFTDNIREITGCRLSSDGKQVVALGTTRDQVVLTVVNATSGQISNLYSLNNYRALRSNQVPSYQTYGAIMLDKEDSRDGKAYIYASFLMDAEQQLVKILQAVPDRTNEFPSIKYHYKFSDVSEAENPNDFVRQKTPQYLFVIPEENEDSFFMSGTYRGVGSVMKFYKRNAALRWHAQLDEMTRVDAIAVREPSSQGQFFGCGRNDADDRRISTSLRTSQSEAWFFSMDKDGEAEWILKLNGATLEQGRLLSDSCQGMVFDPVSDTIITVVETDSPQFRVENDDEQRDTMLLEIDINGALQRVVSFTLGGKTNGMFSHPQNLVKANDYYYMSGNLIGFQTRVKMDLKTNTDFDSFLIPLGLDEERPTRRCIVDREINRFNLVPFGEFFGQTQSRSIYELRRDNDREVPKSQQDDSVFRVNYSKFVNARPLKSFINTPRPCAFQSTQLSEQPIEYFRGSEAITYRIADESPYSTLITQMAPELGGTTLVIDQKGKETDLAQFSPAEGGIVEFYSNVVRQIGLNELTIRHCDLFERLFDFRLRIEVKMNSQPIFMDIPETTFTFAVNDTFVYRLPETTDPEGNAQAQILVEPFDGYEDLFPPFLNVFNWNRTFQFDVNSTEYAGKQYFFKIVLKEAGVNAIGFPYYSQVLIDPIDEPEEPVDPSTDTEGSEQAEGETESSEQLVTEPEEATTTVVTRQRKGNVIASDSFEQAQENQYIFYEVYTTDLVGRTQIKFLEESTDMLLVEEDFADLFTVAVQKSDYFYEPKNITLLDFKYSNFNKDNRTVDLQFRFRQPNDLGLNTEKSDFVYFTRNVDYPWTEILGTALVIPEGKTLQDQARARIELTFDYENTQMRNVVVFSSLFMIMMVLMIAAQLMILLYKNVGLLTFWVLFDYAQLVAYLPLQTARCVPFVYEAFRPFLISHLIFTFPGDQGMENQDPAQYYIQSFQAYDIDKDLLLEWTSILWASILAFIIVIDILITIASKKVKYNENSPKLYNLVQKLKEQFRFNIYIRYLMMAYLDLVFISGIILFDSDDALALKSIIALLVLSFTVCVPVLVTIYLCAKFDKLRLKESKQNFNTLLLKVDKEDRWRIFLPIFFFFRRFVTAVMLMLGADGRAPAYLQFAVIITLSAILMFYLAKEEPYVQRKFNMYVFSMELLYFLLGMAIFTFTDATGEVDLKRVAAIICIILLSLFVLVNFIVAIYFARKGRASLRQSDIRSKLFRQNEVVRRANEKQRRKDKRKRKKQKEREAIDLKRLEQLQVKRDQMRQEGYTEEEINAKLPEEPVPVSGFKFGGVMGKRLIDYGIMSSSSDSQQEDEDGPFVVKEGKETEMTEIRRTSTVLPTHDDEQDEQQYTERLETEAPLTAQKLMGSQDRTADLTGQTDFKPNEQWMEDIMSDNKNAEDRHNTANTQKNAQDSKNGSAVDFYYDAPPTERALFTEANEEDEDRLQVPSYFRNKKPETSSAEGENLFNQDPWTTQNNITGQSSQHNMLDTSRQQQDERIMRMANDQQQQQQPRGSNP